MNAAGRHDIEVLRLFMRRASELEACRLIKAGYKASWNIEWSREQGTSVAGNEPDEEDFRSFLLTFRQFISPKESIFINNAYNILHLRVTSAEIRDDLAVSRQVFKEEKEGQFMELVRSDRRLHSASILDTWINGYYFHNDQVKHDLIIGLHPIESVILRHALHNVIQRTTEEVLYIASIIELVLIDGFISTD